MDLVAVEMIQPLASSVGNCPDVNPVVRLQNYSTEQLTYFEFSYSLDGGELITGYWSDFLNLIEPFGFFEFEVPIERVREIVEKSAHLSQVRGIGVLAEFLAALQQIFLEQTESVVLVVDLFSQIFRNIHQAFPLVTWGLSRPRANSYSYRLRLLGHEAGAPIKARKRPVYRKGGR